jgi:ABC-type amino acid transport substrate-binding protein
MRIVCAALAAGLALPSAAAPRPLTAGVFEAPPFAMKTASGGWSGLEVELFGEAARRMGSAYTLREGTRDALLAGLADGSVDVVVGPVPVTMDLERTVDFSHIVADADLAIATVPETEADRWRAVLRSFFSLAFLRVLATLLALLLGAGFLLWYFERRQNPEFGGDATAGVGSGLWWAGVTYTGVGYGDKVPVTFGGRIVAFVWMLASLILVSAFTASITARLAVRHLQGVRGPEDLATRVSAVLAGSPAETWLRERRFRARSFDSLEAALRALLAKRVDAVVGGSYQLEWLSTREETLRIDVKRVDAARQSYAFALPEGSPLRKPLNRALLTVLESPRRREIEARYLGR